MQIYRKEKVKKNFSDNIAVEMDCDLHVFNSLFWIKYIVYVTHRKQKLKIQCTQKPAKVLKKLN